MHTSLLVACVLVLVVVLAGQASTSAVSSTTTQNVSPISPFTQCGFFTLSYKVSTMSCMHTELLCKQAGIRIKNCMHACMGQR
jgi:hypothetical protein